MSFRYRLGAWSDLLKRYGKVFAYFWRRRRELSLPTLEAHEAEFLPAALALQAQAVSPAGRWVARILIMLVLVLILWATLGKIDITVNASGKVIPSARTKTIASVEIASVRALHVEEGQAVKVGDVLVELDTRSSDSERDKAKANRLTAQLQAARSRALVAAIDGGREPVLKSLEDIPPQQRQDAIQQLQGQWRDFISKRQRLDGEIRRYSDALSLATQRAQDYAELARDRDVSQHAWLEKEQARIDLQGQLDESRNQRSVLIAETRKEAQDTLNEASRIIADSTQDERRAEAHSELLKLLAPVDGTVQQLTVHTVGGVVPAAQALMQIVPQQSGTEVEAFLENKDVGFVREGQLAQVKIDTFEYTKYGTIPAHITHVSRDAIQDEKKGLIYSVKVALDKTSIQVDGKDTPLSPGMSANVEIKTGTRRIIEYVLSPLIQHGQESLRER